MTLKEGDKAPSFTSTDEDGQPISLSDFKGKRIALFFYPEDDTPTCTIEACNLRDNFSVFKENGIIILGVSPDDEEKHKKFKKKFKLPFTLITDPHKKIIEKYGVWGEKNLYGRKYMGLQRTTFLIDELGFIRKIFRKPNSKIHSGEILKAWNEIGAANRY